MPTPKENENKKDFINRCIPVVIKEGTTDDPKQAVAICNNIWSDYQQEHSESGLKYPDI